MRRNVDLRRLTGHRSHDAAELIDRWVRAGARCGWQTEELTRSAGFPVLALHSPASGRNGLYISAGMHGDEAAPPWALLDWFETEGHRLRDRPITLFPCLNPWGLVTNSRLNEMGEDLNRQFHREDHPLVNAWRSCIQERRYALSLCLHEDYDAQGVYVYELYRSGAERVATRLLGAAADQIPVDPRGKIDGRAATSGIIRRSRIPADLPGHPEAIALHSLGFTRHNLTFETPSEFSLDVRIDAHRSFIDAAVQYLGW